MDMKKTWNEATLTEVNVKDTAFGPYNPENPDSEKTQITKPNGQTGFVQEFGDGHASQGSF